jgi:hypothetical protein
MTTLVRRRFIRTTIHVHKVLTTVPSMHLQDYLLAQHVTLVDTVLLELKKLPLEVVKVVSIVHQDQVSKNPLEDSIL